MAAAMAVVEPLNRRHRHRSLCRRLEARQAGSPRAAAILAVAARRHAHVMSIPSTLTQAAMRSPRRSREEEATMVSWLRSWRSHRSSWRSTDHNSLRTLRSSTRYAKSFVLQESSSSRFQGSPPQLRLRQYPCLHSSQRRANGLRRRSRPSRTCSPTARAARTATSPRRRRQILRTWQLRRRYATFQRRSNALSARCLRRRRHLLVRRRRRRKCMSCRR